MKFSRSFFVSSFYKRDRELDSLNDIFVKNIIHDKANKTIIVKGPFGIGKTRLINEFLKFLSSQKIANLTPDFDPNKHIIRYDYGREPREEVQYEAFLKIKEDIDSKNKKFTILSKLFRLGLSL